MILDCHEAEVDGLFDPFLGFTMQAHHLSKQVPPLFEPDTFHSSEPGFFRDATFLPATARRIAFCRSLTWISRV